MRKLFSFAVILLFGVLCSACVNTFAVHELNQIANNYLEKGDVESAISRLEASVDLDGNVYETRYNLAVAYLKINECQKALDNITAAEKLTKNEPLVYYTKAIANSCLADKIEKSEDKNQDAKAKLVSYLNEANKNYEYYLELSPDADDAQDVKTLVESNKETIRQTEEN